MCGRDPVSHVVEHFFGQIQIEERIDQKIFLAIDVADPGVLVVLAERCGLEGHGLLEAADAEAVRAEYRGNTERALAAGVFGSPFYAFAGELFWGQDRLDMLEEAIVRSVTGYPGRGPD